jgi:DNA-binding ferritin-like protein
MSATMSNEDVLAAMEDAYQRMNATYDRIAERVLTPEEHAQFVALYQARSARLEETQRRLEAGNAKWMEAMESEQKKWTNLRRWSTWVTWACFWLSGFLMRGNFP